MSQCKVFVSFQNEKTKEKNPVAGFALEIPDAYMYKICSQESVQVVLSSVNFSTKASPFF